MWLSLYHLAINAVGLEILILILRTFLGDEGSRKKAQVIFRIFNDIRGIPLSIESLENVVQFIFAGKCPGKIGISSFYDLSAFKIMLCHGCPACFPAWIIPRKKPPPHSLLSQIDLGKIWRQTFLPVLGQPL